MKTINENEGAGEDVTEATTGEYPVIKEEAQVPAEHLNGAHRSVEADGAKAAFWLTHLETEVTRLHAKWHSIDAEFKVRETRIAELRDEVKAREATVEKLNTDLHDGAEALKAADARIGRKEAEIAGLIVEREARNGKVAELAAALEGAEDRHRALQQTVATAQADIARLNAAVRQEQETAAGVAGINEQLLGEQRVLQGKLHDLEIYINGRHQSWSDLNTHLADYKDALVGMERTLKTRDAAVARHDEEKRQLAARILDLERQCSELIGRRKEREAAYDELQMKLAEHFEVMERQKVEHANRAKETEQALAKALNSQKMVDSLERGIMRRDENLTALGAELEQHKSAVGDLSEAKEKLTKRLDDLERTLHERSQQAQALREDLLTSHNQLQTLKGQLSERDGQLASSRTAADDKGRLAEKLTRDLRALEKESADVRNDLARLEEHAAELGRLRSDALAESDHLKAELAAQQELVASLETELRAKQATADLLERNVGRITDLGASLAALDRRMDGGADAPNPDIHFPDFIETIASDAGLEIEESKELLSLDAMIGGPEQGADVVDIGQPERKQVARKLVVMLGEQGVDYPLVKKEMTIGRGHGTDIRIASHFISRIHAKVSTNGLATVIEDAGSKNGILVNSERVQRRVLRDGDVVSLGGELNLRYVDARP